jgi:hypothetical protein
LAGAQTADAAAVTYNLMSGEVVAVTLGLDQTNRLVETVSLDAGQVSVDFDALLLNILSVSAAGPGTVNTGGINGWDSVTFTNASFASTEARPLTDAGGGQYNYGIPVLVLADLELDPGNVIFENFSAPSAAVGDITALNGNQTIDITINGVVLGELRDPIYPENPPVSVKADFHFIANQTPEPSIIVLMLLGLASLAWRQRA